MKGETILVVDDDPLLADLIAIRLEEEGYEVLQAHDGQMALDMMRDFHTDLIITDFMMPRMTGLELARAIRAQQRYVRLPIMLISGANGSVGRDNPDLFDAVLDRPHGPQKLVDEVHAVLN